MSQPAERVYTMTDYYDGPRGGIADYHGVPHIYRSLWADIRRDRPDVFELTPIAQESLALALEDWEIWRRWHASFHRGEATQDTHPALPGDRERHDELTALLLEDLSITSPDSITAEAEFDWSPPEYNALLAPTTVRWTPVERPTDCLTVSEDDSP